MREFEVEVVEEIQNISDYRLTDVFPLEHAGDGWSAYLIYKYIKYEI